MSDESPYEELERLREQAEGFAITLFAHEMAALTLSVVCTGLMNRMRLNPNFGANVADLVNDRLKAEAHAFVEQHGPDVDPEVLIKHVAEWADASEVFERSVVDVSKGVRAKP